ncbi:hypothetical protein DFH07DRAFT_589907 [Mycena maculata]|uniref:Uncharacterized protein n=1 Tax=Mycena maculata TaxID=230809 RepID=A0AAD7IMB1_9AGAR|nr:hypothetical protein DFH07DRAFT_589907 [Mycena maculata]
MRPGVILGTRVRGSRPKAETMCARSTNQNTRVPRVLMARRSCTASPPPTPDSPTVKSGKSRIHCVDCVRPLYDRGKDSRLYLPNAHCVVMRYSSCRKGSEFKVKTAGGLRGRTSGTRGSLGCHSTSSGPVVRVQRFKSLVRGSRRRNDVAFARGIDKGGGRAAVMAALGADKADGGVHVSAAAWWKGRAAVTASSTVPAAGRADGLALGRRTAHGAHKDLPRVIGSYRSPRENRSPHLHLLLLLLTPSAGGALGERTVFGRIEEEGVRAVSPDREGAFHAKITDSQSFCTCIPFLLRLILLRYSMSRRPSARRRYGNTFDNI